MMKKLRNIFIGVLVCLLVGLIASVLQADSIAYWYPHLNKSPLTPPNYVFPIAWTFLYICMGISFGLVRASEDPKKGRLLLLFDAQLFFNFIWSIVFFYLRNPLLGLAVIAILEVLIILYAAKAYPSHKVSAILFFPYIAWVSFAIYLNLYVVLNN